MSKSRTHIGNLDLILIGNRTRGLLDFIYYAQYQSHTTDTLRRMQEALGTKMSSLMKVFATISIFRNSILSFTTLTP